MTEKLDVYSRVTNKIIADLERGNLTWLQPWQAGHKAGSISRPLRAGGKAYSGVNVLMLWAAAMEKGYSCPLWLTYKQAAELGGQVRKGEKGSLVRRASDSRCLKLFRDEALNTRNHVRHVIILKLFMVAVRCIVPDVS